MPASVHGWPGSPQKRPTRLERDRVGLERLVFFSDAVFAIAITLLALEIRLPELAPDVTNAGLRAVLLSLWEEYLAFVVSFWVIGTFWLAHHRKLGLVQRYDHTLLVLNLAMLMIVAFIPFPTSVISKSGSRAATIFYALTMVAVGLVMAALWWHASQHNRLVDPRMGAVRRRRELITPLLTSGVFGLSIGIAYVNENLSRLFWLLVLVVASTYASRR